MRNSALAAFAFTLALYGQTAPPQSVPPPTRVRTLTPTGRGDIRGSVPSAQTAGPPISLTLEDAVQRGLKTNLASIANQQSVRSAEGAHAIERSGLLPYVSTNLLMTDQQTNLAALGFTGFPGIPQIVGPYHYFDLRGGASQSLFDLTRLRNYRSSRESLNAARFNAEDIHDLIALAVTDGYLRVLSASARVKSGQARVAAAQATYRQAVDRNQAGVAPRIDVTRSQVELQMEQQRLTSAENDFGKLKIALGRVIGLPPGQDFTLADSMPFAPLTSLTIDEAIRRAYANRPDLKAAQAQVRAAELAKGAAAAERYPTAQVGGDYGVIGPDPSNAHGTFGASAAVRLPIFQGGRVQGDILQADAALQQRRAELEDLRARVDADIRSAFLDLTSAASQVGVADSNRRLAQETLTQARDRFAAGVADTVEVVQAQEAVAVAEEDYIAALYAHNLAKATIARGLGQADQNLREFLPRR
jgi:outer membrane protein TolC